MKKYLLPLFGMAAYFTACEDELTPVSGNSAETVTAFSDLSECNKDIIGKFVYVSDSVKVYACTDNGWAAVTGAAVSGSNGSDGHDGANGKDGTNGKDGKNGTDGKNGKDGTDGKDGVDGKDGKSCTMTAFKDGSGFDVICDGKSIGSVKNGTNGKDGAPGTNGKDGTSCSVAKAADSDDVVVTCGDKSVTIHNGVDGKQGEPGTPGTKGADGTNGSNGADGVSCKIASDENGIVQIQCGEGKDATSTKLYKAFCGSKPFDPEKSFCMADGSVYPLCNGETYVPDTDECVGGVVVQFIKSCGDELYNAHEKFCVNDKTYDLCGGESYDIELVECVEGKKTLVYEKCGDEKFKIADADHLFCAEFENKTTGEKTYQVYKYTTIEVKDKDYSETWMAENLNYEVENSSCYKDISSNCDTYGRLYTWAAAVGRTEDECGSGKLCISEGVVQGICPEGWHLPSKAEWGELFDAVGGASAAFTVLRSNEGWKNSNGTDKYGFTMLPGGEYIVESEGVPFSGYYYISNDASFWTSDADGKTHAYGILLNVDVGLSINKSYSKDDQFSVRCVKDLVTE